MGETGTTIRVLFVSTEYAPFSKVGGLGDVAGSLPKALRRAGVDVRVVTPAWPGVLDRVFASGLKTTVLPERVCAAHDWRIRDAEVVKTEVEDVPVYFLRSEDYMGDMYPWHLDSRTASPFAIFCMQALELHRILKWKPDLYHCHDWTSAFLPCALAWHRHYRHVGGRSIITLHNVAHQGILEREPFMEASGLEPWSFNMEAMEFYGQVNLLKGAIVAANAVTTVSPRYAQEIQTYESTQELSGVIYKQRHKLSGILNGIDTDYWNPDTDRHLPERFSAKNLKGKARAREELLNRAGFAPQSQEPVVVCVSRLVEQKGFTLILSALETLPTLGAKFVFLGSGHGWIENALRQANERHPDIFRFFQGYDEPLSHLLYAGGDIFLMPSVFEPCGLSQMIAMRYGTIPVVREVGGLKDTVTDVDSPEGGNGFTFQTCDTVGMLWALQRATARFRDAEDWDRIRVRAMQEDFTWSKSALLYKALYRKTLL
ncbi:glycogen synthase [Fretibacterium sp. OH1220_COT-178]|uniref:glycogen synthase n=1 Tax=Fretibacterium sp. OH1220_COT-178 TaxID=2491047 RepID=UPI000F5FCFA4|nr:glycogen/starch synthase [Fretibacterium sp. OH1220_COT-178]RRD64834.1 glycogen synthase [Fretibacterium sp. OH1220_COT-178]